MAIVTISETICDYNSFAAVGNSKNIWPSMHFVSLIMYVYHSELLS